MLPGAGKDLSAGLPSVSVSDVARFSSGFHMHFSPHVTPCVKHTKLSFYPPPFTLVCCGLMFKGLGFSEVM